MPQSPISRTLPIEKTGDSGAKVAGFNGATQYSPNDARGAIITLVASAASGSNTMQLQRSYDGGTTFINFGPTSTALTGAGNASFYVYPTNTSQAAGATPANLTTGGTVAAIMLNTVIPPVWRIVFTVPTSITITAVHVEYLP